MVEVGKLVFVPAGGGGLAGAGAGGGGKATGGMAGVRAGVFGGETKGISAGIGKMVGALGLIGILLKPLHDIIDTLLKPVLQILMIYFMKFIFGLWTRLDKLAETKEDLETIIEEGADAATKAIEDAFPPGTEGPLETVLKDVVDVGEAAANLALEFMDMGNILGLFTTGNIMPFVDEILILAYEIWDLWESVTSLLRGAFLKVGGWVFTTLSDIKAWGFDKLFAVGAWIWGELTKYPTWMFGKLAQIGSWVWTELTKVASWGLEVLKGIGSWIVETIKGIISSVVDTMTGGGGEGGGGGGAGRLVQMGKKFLGLEDFIMRPGQAPVAFDSGDTIVGTKGGAGGGVTINVNNPVLMDDAAIRTLTERVSEEMQTTIGGNVSY